MQTQEYKARRRCRCRHLEAVVVIAYTHRGSIGRTKSRSVMCRQEHDGWVRRAEHSIVTLAERDVGQVKRWQRLEREVVNLEDVVRPSD